MDGGNFRLEILLHPTDRCMQTIDHIENMTAVNWNPSVVHSVVFEMNPIVTRYASFTLVLPAAVPHILYINDCRC